MRSAAKKKDTDDGIDFSDIPEITRDDARWKIVHRGPSRSRSHRLELPLEGVRKAFGKTQVDVANASGIDQAYVSRLENRDELGDVALETLRRYVSALGGELELVVLSPNGARIFLRDVRAVTALDAKPRPVAKPPRRVRAKADAPVTGRARKQHRS